MIYASHRDFRFTIVVVCATIFLLSLTTTMTPGDETVPSNPEPKWWKGNIHTHSLWSDGDDFPEMIAEWYRTHDYNFLALSDHNVLADGMRWMTHDKIIQRGGENVVAKYVERFGRHWVETKGQVGSEDHQIRLKPLNEFRSLVESRGQFIMMTGEEISDSVGGKPVHMNATNLEDLILPLGGESISQAISANLRAAREQAQRKGREILVHLNHPNFGYAITAQELAAVIDENFFEVYNGHPDIKHLGDEAHPSVEKIWDLVCTLRIAHYKAPPVMGVATDDSHDYHGKKNGASTGRGWVMVRSRHLTAESIIRAMQRGDFYASSGVSLDQIAFDPSKQQIVLNIKNEGDAQFVTQFIGTRKAAGSPAVNDQDKEEGQVKTDDQDKEERTAEASIGEVFATITGSTATYDLKGDELYVRACVTSSVPHDNPSFDGQMQQAWTQPVGWQKHLKEPAQP